MIGPKSLIVAMIAISGILYTNTRTATAADSGYAHLFEMASQTWEIPAPLIKAIAETESGYHPWAVNIAGRSYYPEAREEALNLIRSAMARKKSFDIGVMQLNSWWLKRLKLAPEQVLDPEPNILIGSWILAQELYRHGYHWKAVGSYHTPVDKNPERARQYASKVLSKMGGGM